MTTNNGALISKARSQAARAQNRKAIMGLPTYQTGFYARDVVGMGFDVSVARRELQDMVKDNILMATKQWDNGLLYTPVPTGLMRKSWGVTDNGVRLGIHRGER